MRVQPLLVAAFLAAILMAATSASAETCVIQHYISSAGIGFAQIRNVHFRAVQDGRLLDEEEAKGEYMEDAEKDEMIETLLAGRKFLIKPTKARVAAFKALVSRLESNGWAMVGHNGSWYGWTFERK